MNKKYTTPLPPYEMWGSRKTSGDGLANKKTSALAMAKWTEPQTPQVCHSNLGIGINALINSSMVL